MKNHRLKTDCDAIALLCLAGINPLPSSVDRVIGELRAEIEALERANKKLRKEAQEGRDDA